MQFRVNRNQRIDVVLLAPATFALGAALPFGVVITVFTLGIGLVVGLLGGSHAFWQTVRSSRELGGLLLMMIAAAAAMASLWLSILRGRDWVFEKPHRKTFIVFAVLAGLAAGGYWLSRLPIPPHDSGELKAVIFRTLLLAGPSVVALRQLWVFFRAGIPARTSH